MKAWFAGFAGRLDALQPSLERSATRRVSLFALTMVGPWVVVFAVFTIARLFGLP